MSADSDRRGQAMHRLRDAAQAWGQAMSAHRMAPPDAGFAARPRALGSAAEREREACEDAGHAGLQWRPIPGAQVGQPPYELRPGTGRHGPDTLWQRFDAAVDDLNHAITGTNVSGVGRAFGELASAAAELADAVDAADRATAAEQLRREAV